MSVPTPDAKRATDTGIPKIKGTKMVAPNMANTCWKLRRIPFPAEGRWSTSKSKSTVDSCFILTSLLGIKKEPIIL